jgi:hypothetical protein
VCGQVVEPRLAWTSAGFTKPLSLVLEPVLRPQREITTRQKDGIVVDVHYRGEVLHLIDERVYLPIQQRALAAAARARRLQSGSLGAYVAYLIGLLIVSLLAVRLGLLG